MISYTQLYTRAADFCGINVSTDTQGLTNIQQDLNQGLGLFKNAARRYWTRLERQANLVQGQQYYQLPPNAVRIIEVRVNSSGLNFPLVRVDSEHLWNKINIIPALTINLPTYYFVKGFNEIGLWPIPSSNVTNGLLISIEPRVFLSVDDFSTGTVTVTNGSTTVTNSGNNFAPAMVNRWFQVTGNNTDGNWYQIATYDSSTQLELANDYAGVSGSGNNFTIAQMPDIPEEYHIGLAYYAACNFYLRRKDKDSASLYQGLFNDLLGQYEETYASKATGVVQNQIQDYRYSLFSLPPNPIS